MSVLCCVSVSHRHTEETRSTLKFANQAKHVSMVPTINEQVVDQTTLVTDLQKELEETRSLLVSLQRQVYDSSTVATPCKRPSVVHLTPNSKCPSPAIASAQTESTVSSSSLSTDDDDDQTFTDLLSHYAVSEGNAIVQEILECVWSKESDGAPPMEEVLVRVKLPVKSDSLLAERLIDSESRAKFLEEKLEATDDLVETLFKDLEGIRKYNLGLKERLDDNMACVNEVGSVEPESSAIVLLMKYAVYIAFCFYLYGQDMVFLATAMFFWLTLEIVE
jgi:hypothetical protein